MARRFARAAALAALLVALAPVRSAVAAESPAAEPALRVYVVRHAQAWKNVPPSMRPAGMTDDKLDALTEQGFAQAEAVGRKLAGAGVARVLSSPMQRARQTAETIARVLERGAPEVSADFRPLENGSNPEAADYRWRTGNWKAGKDPRPPAGESLADGLARAAARIDAIAREAPGSALAVVTHGEITSALISKAAGISPLDGYSRNFVGEGAISEIHVLTEGGWRLVGKGAKP